MLHDQVVRRTSLQRLGKILQPLRAKALVYRVHDGDLLVQNDIGIVGHPVRDDVLPLEQVDLAVVYADVADVVCDVHRLFSFPVFFQYTTGGTKIKGLGARLHFFVSSVTMTDERSWLT